MRAALWLRVSKDEQNPDNQELVLRRWAEQLHLDVVKVYRLAGYSASKGEQDAQLAEMFLDAHHGEFNVLLVKSLDRLERRGPTALLNMVQRLDYQRIQLRSLDEPWASSDNPMREIFMAVAGWFAKHEAEKISERSKAGLARRKAQGLPVGRQPGAKDKRPRKRSGYLLRYERERRRNE